MIRLVYISQATKPFSSDALLSLLKECRQNNAKNGLTGTLLYYNECFIQALEGNEEDVNRIFKIIKQDSRHKNIVELDRRYITERQFAAWSMGFEEVNEAQLKALNIEGLNHFFNENLQDNHSPVNQQMIASLMTFFKQSYDKRKKHEELPIDDDQQKVLTLFNKAIRFAVTVLAFLMVLVIFLGVADVIYVIYQKLVSPPFLLLTIPDILATFGAFLAVLIAIEIFLNISIYLRSDVMPVKLVVATALMAISRKVIVFDFKNLEPDYIYASAAVVLGLGITYWLVNNKEKDAE